MCLVTGRARIREFCKGRTRLDFVLVVGCLVSDLGVFVVGVGEPEAPLLVTPGWLVFGQSCSKRLELLVSFSMAAESGESAARAFLSLARGVLARAL